MVYYFGLVDVCHFSFCLHDVFRLSGGIPIHIGKNEKIFFNVQKILGTGFSLGTDENWNQTYFF